MRPIIIIFLFLMLLNFSSKAISQNGSDTIKSSVTILRNKVKVYDEPKTEIVSNSKESKESKEDTLKLSKKNLKDTIIDNNRRQYFYYRNRLLIYDSSDNSFYDPYRGIYYYYYGYDSFWGREIYVARYGSLRYANYYNNYYYNRPRYNNYYRQEPPRVSYPTRRSSRR